MHKLYHFSPIKSEEEFFEAINYIANSTSELCKKVTGQTLPIAWLTIFSHYPDEYETLKQIVFSLGKQTSENNGPYVTLDTPLKFTNNTITCIRIRKPDPYRMQVGCSDFDIQNYEDFKSQFLLQNPNNLRLIERSEFEMIEFFDPDFDVFAYILSTPAGR